MDTETTPQVPPSTPEAPKNKRALKKPIVITVIALLVAALGVVGYLYLGEKNEVQQLSSEVEKHKNLEATEAESTSEEAPEVPVQKTTYTAEVGKFTLTLDPKYTIIKKLDGGFEGGPATYLQIATQTKNKNVVDAPELMTVEINAVPRGSNGTFDEFIKNSLGENTTTKQPNVTIDGKAAAVYLVAGFGVEKQIFFQNNSIYYTIKYEDSSEQVTKTIADVIAGFKFN